MNFNTWNAKVLNIMEEHNWDTYVSTFVQDPTSNARCINFKKNQAKAKRIIYDSVKDNLMFVITPLKTAKECFDILTNLYEKKAPIQKRPLKKKLWNLKMDKDETVASFFTKISQVRDQLTSIGVVVDEDDLIQTIVDGIPSTWDTFLVVFNG